MDPKITSNPYKSQWGNQDIEKIRKKNIEWGQGEVSPQQHRVRSLYFLEADHRLELKHRGETVSQMDWSVLLISINWLSEDLNCFWFREPFPWCAQKENACKTWQTMCLNTTTVTEQQGSWVYSHNTPYWGSLAECPCQVEEKQF